MATFPTLGGGGDAQHATETKGREGHGDHCESWWDTGPQSHLLPRAGGVSTCPETSRRTPLGERASQSQVTGALVFRKL